MNSSLDNIDLLRALMIADNYSSFKKDEKKVVEKNPSFKNEPLNGKDVERLYSSDPRLKELDKKYLRGGNYQIGLSTVSKFRVLKNMHNYIGNGDPLIEALRYNSECRDIDEVIRTVKSLESTIEVGDDNVRLSKGL